MVAITCTCSHLSVYMFHTCRLHACIYNTAHVHVSHITPLSCTLQLEVGDSSSGEEYSPVDNSSMELLQLFQRLIVGIIYSHTLPDKEEGKNKATSSLPKCVCTMGIYN